MVLVNYTTRELTAKLVFYGPGLCGKTTNLQYIFENLLPPDRRGKMVSLNTETDRTLFFDFLPLEIGTIRGLKTRLQLYTVPGQVHYNATRKIVLKGADGIVFVADSQVTAREGNIESYKNMKQNLAEHGLDLRNVPFVLQFNKRDLPNVMPVEQMAADLNEFNVPFWDAVAVQGIGVEDTLKGLVRLVMKNLAGRFQSEGKDAPAAAAAAPVPAPAVLPPAAAALPAAAPAMAEPAALPGFPPAPPAFTPPPQPAFTPPPAPVFTPAPAPVSTPPPAPVFTPPPAPAFTQMPEPAAPPAPMPWPPPVAAGPLELELEPESQGEVLDLGEEQYVVEDSGPSDVGGAFDAALASGDTIVAPGGFVPPPVPVFEPPPMATPVAPDLEAALLSGDTVMSFGPQPGLLTEMPASFDAPPPQPAGPPAHAPAPAAPAAAFEAPAELSLDDSPFGGGGGDLESSLLGGATFDPAPAGGLDLESALMGGAPVAPAPSVAASPTPPATPAFTAPEPLAARVSAPEPTPAPAPAPSAASVPEPPQVVQVEAALQLGRVATGEMVRRIVRLPVEFEDASGRRSTTLTVRLEFRID